MPTASLLSASSCAKEHTGMVNAANSVAVKHLVIICMFIKVD
jgi:hypothetical protein